LPVFLEESVILFVFEIVKLIEIFIFKAIVVSALLGFEKCFLDYGSRWWGLLGDDFMGSEDVIPGWVLN
jgi:hypothetical protein